MRVVFEFGEKVGSLEWAELERVLQVENARLLHPPAATDQPPILLVAITSDEEKAAQLLSHLKALASVRNAELDRMRFTL